MVEKNAVQSTPDEHIGTKSHPQRNLLLGVGVLAAAGLIGLFYWRSGSSNDAALQELDKFRQLMATQCKQEQFARPAQKGLNSVYADSSRMQAVVHEQLGSLQRSQVNCDQVLKTLKSVDYPVE